MKKNLTSGYEKEYGSGRDNEIVVERNPPYGRGKILQ